MKTYVRCWMPWLESAHIEIERCNRTTQGFYVFIEKYQIHFRVYVFLYELHMKWNETNIENRTVATPLCTHARSLVHSFAHTCSSIYFSICSHTNTLLFLLGSTIITIILYYFYDFFIIIFVIFLKIKNSIFFWFVPAERPPIRWRLN